MDNPRAEKVAVVDEVRERFSSSEAVMFTEYRGISVDEMAQLRRSLRAVGGDYKIFKNTLVRFAVKELGLDVEDLLVGPTAIAFVPSTGDGDPVTVAKVLREFARSNPNLVVKGGVLGEKLLSLAEVTALAEVAPREELLARFAGGLAAPMQQFAGLLGAIPRNFAYGLSALIAKGGASDAPAPEAAAEAQPEPEPAEAEPQADTAEEPQAESSEPESSEQESSEQESGTAAPAAQTDTEEG